MYLKNVFFQNRELFCITFCTLSFNHLTIHYRSNKLPNFCWVIFQFRNIFELHIWMFSAFEILHLNIIEKFLTHRIPIINKIRLLTFSFNIQKCKKISETGLFLTKSFLSRTEKSRTLSFAIHLKFWLLLKTIEKLNFPVHITFWNFYKDSYFSMLFVITTFIRVVMCLFVIVWL